MYYYSMSEAKALIHSFKKVCAQGRGIFITDLQHLLISQSKLYKVQSQSHENYLVHCYKLTSNRSWKS